MPPLRRQEASGDMPAYYNEIDPYAAQWLRNLIAAGHIAPGDVDERDIRDIRPDDLRGYDQCHFFAGIGVWSRALREAGWSDDRPVWTGSCPCQPFSAAGQRGGFADERHLWPAFHYLIAQCRPARILGEQVASPDALRWLDLVSADLEGAGYAVGAADLCAAGDCVAAGETETGRATIEWIQRAVLTCPDPVLAAELSDFAEWSGESLGVGPAHIRQRLCWMADADKQFDDGSRIGGAAGRIESADGCAISALAGAVPAGRAERWSGAGDRSLVGRGCVSGLGVADGERSSPRREAAARMGHGCPAVAAGVDDGAASALGELGHADDARPQGRIEHRHGAGQRIARPTGVARFADPDWIVCTDGKARPIEPGAFPLAHGIAGRVGRLRGYGNAMHLGKIAAFIRAADDACNDTKAASEVAP